MVKLFIGGTTKVTVSTDDISSAISIIGLENGIHCVIGGLDSSVELAGKSWAEETHRMYEEHIPHPELGPIMWVARNKTVVAHADVFLIFWDGKSSGARNLMNAAAKRGKTVYMAQCYRGKWNNTITKWIPPSDTDWNSVW